MFGRILKSLNIVNFYRGMSKLKLKINVKVPQWLCIAVSVALNGEFERLITGIRKHDHITPILMDLHWLPVNERIQFKILLLTFKSLNGLAPVYVDEMIQRYVPNRKLRSSSAFLLKQNKWNLKSYGLRTLQ